MNQTFKKLISPQKVLLILSETNFPKPDSLQNRYKKSTKENGSSPLQLQCYLQKLIIVFTQVIQILRELTRALDGISHIYHRKVWMPKTELKC